MPSKCCAFQDVISCKWSSFVSFPDQSSGLNFQLPSGCLFLTWRIFSQDLALQSHPCLGSFFLECVIFPTSLPRCCFSCYCVHWFAYAPAPETIVSLGQLWNGDRKMGRIWPCGPLALFFWVSALGGLFFLVFSATLGLRKVLICF